MVQVNIIIIFGQIQQQRANKKNLTFDLTDEQFNKFTNVQMINVIIVIKKKQIIMSMELIEKIIIQDILQKSVLHVVVNVIR